MDIKEENTLGSAINTHWYYTHKLALIGALLHKYSRGLPSILDVGAGSGFFSKALLRENRIKNAYCVDIEYEQNYREDSDYANKLIFSNASPDREKDLALFMDVLEHVEDDVGMLMSYKSCIRDGGQIVITVPAFNWLWSNHDVYLEHERRYSLTQLEHVVKSAGLSIEY